jgi:hypothetical protein
MSRFGTLDATGRLAALALGLSAAWGMSGCTINEGDESPDEIEIEADEDDDVDADIEIDD